MDCDDRGGVPVTGCPLVPTYVQYTLSVYMQFHSSYHQYDNQVRTPRNHSTCLRAYRFGKSYPDYYSCSIFGALT